MGNISSATPILKVHFQIQVGSYRLEVALFVASVGGDAGPNNEGNNCFSDSIFPTDSPVTRYAIRSCTLESANPTPTPSDPEP
jgi:hypothetical protein